MKRCDLARCQAVCCYDGVYIDGGEEKRIRALVKENREFFAFLPKVYLVSAKWGGLKGLKTATRPFVYRSRPAHFADTRCVFAYEDGRCSFQVLATQQGKHPWEHKPTACWLHPLRLSLRGLVPPPANKAEDPDRLEGYPGYVCYTPCGEHAPEDPPWQETLAEEVAWSKKVGVVPKAP